MCGGYGEKTAREAGTGRVKQWERTHVRGEQGQQGAQSRGATAGTDRVPDIRLRSGDQGDRPTRGCE